MSRRSLRPSSISLPSIAPRAIAPGEMRRTNGRGEFEVLLDRQVIVEGIVLRDVGDEAFQRIEIRIKATAH